MKTFVLNIMLSLVLLNSVFAQTDVKNWENIPWKSTTAQIQALFGNRLTQLEERRIYVDGDYCDFIIGDYQIFDESFTARFILDSSFDRLQEVMLISNKIDSGDKQTLTNGSKLYNDILDLMKIEYGEPDNSENKKEDDYDGETYILKHSSNWFFNSTVIELHFSYMEGISSQLIIKYNEANQDFDFRKAKWGFSKEKVKASEEFDAIMGMKDKIEFETTVADTKCLVGYFFVENKLAKANYKFLINHSNKNDFISDYQRIGELLCEKYGGDVASKQYPNSDQYWSNELYKDNFQNRGMAISLGHMFYMSEWYTPETEIILRLYGNNSEINLEVDYSSRKYQNLLKKAILKDF